MPPLRFICPATGNEVDTDIDLDGQSFAALPRHITPFGCPHCDEPHLLAGIRRGSANSNPTTGKPGQGFRSRMNAASCRSRRDRIG